MPRIQLTFEIEITEEALNQMRRNQDNGDFDEAEARALMQEVQPLVNLVHVADNN